MKKISSTNILTKIFKKKPVKKVKKKYQNFLQKKLKNLK